MSADIAQFLDGIVASFGFVAYALVLGGLAWVFGVLQPWRRRQNGVAEATRIGMRLIVVGAVALSLCHLLQIALKAQVIAEVIKASPFPNYLETTVFRANLARAALAVLLAGAVLRLDRRPASLGHWSIVIAIALVTAVSGAWLVHGASRLDQRLLLMSLSTVHQIAGVIWVGGVIHIVALSRLGMKNSEVAALWPGAFAGFTPIGMIVVATLLLTGVPLTLNYVATLEGLAGTAYGSVLVAKWVLMASALGLAFQNFLGARTWRRDVNAAMPSNILAETESLILIVVLFVAVALASLPPATDITTERASFAEIIDAFAPKKPQITSPTFAQESAAAIESNVVPRQIASAQELWSDYNHNVSGLILLAIALVALLGHTGKVSWARHWPLGFLAIAVFVLLRSDPDEWPTGRIGLIGSLASPSWIQHKIAGLIPIAFAITEWRVRTSPEANPKLRFIFPSLVIVGGLLLLTHSHGAFELKNEYLIQVSHTAMGTLATLMGCLRWLEIRLSGPAGRLAGLGSIVAMNLIAIVLIFYREPLG